MCVPLHLIFQQVRPYGSRMFKPPDENEDLGGYSRWIGGVHIGGETLASLKDNEYRFWKGSSFIYDGEGWAQCRSCMIVCRSEEMRKAHQKSMGCTRHLIDAYKRLLAKKVCVICKARTTAKKWGIPMCSTGDCREDFKTRAFLHGLQEAINENASL